MFNNKSLYEKVQDAIILFQFERVGYKAEITIQIYDFSISFASGIIMFNFSA